MIESVQREGDVAMIVPRYYENLTALHDNTMPARAYYIPASVRMEDLVEHTRNAAALSNKGAGAGVLYRDADPAHSPCEKG